MADVSFYKYLEAAFRYKVYKNPDATTFKYLNYNLPYEGIGGTKGIFDYARKILPKFYVDTSEFPNTEEGNFSLAKKVLEKLDKGEDAELENQFKGLNPSEEHDQIFHEAATDSQVHEQQTGTPHPGGESAGSMFGGAGSSSSALRSPSRYGPPLHIEKPEQKIFVANKGGVVTEERVVTPHGSTPVVKEAPKLVTANKSGAIIGGEGTQSKIFVANSSGKVVGEHSVPTTPQRLNAGGLKVPNSVKNFGSNAGIGVRRMASGLGRGIVGPGLTGASNFLGRAGIGGINVFSNLSSQIGGGGVFRGGFLGKNTGKRVAIAFLGIFLLFGVFAGIMGGGASSPGGTTPGGNVGVGLTAPVSGTPITPSIGLNGPSNFVYYCQGNTSMQECQLGAAGCGPASVAMIMSTFGVAQTPVDVDRVFRANGWRSCSDAGSHLETAIKSSWFREAGFQTGPNIGNGSLNTAQAKRYLEEGWLIIGSSDQYPCVNCASSRFISHIFVVDAIDVASNRVDIRDPNNCSYTDGNDEIQANRIRDINFIPWRYAYPIKLVR